MIIFRIRLWDSPEGVHIDKEVEQKEPVTFDEISYANKLDHSLKDFAKPSKFSSFMTFLLFTFLGYCVGCWATSLMASMASEENPFSLKSHLLALLTIPATAALFTIAIYDLIFRRSKK